MKFLSLSWLRVGFFVGVLSAVILEALGITLTPKETFIAMVVVVLFVSGLEIVLRLSKDRRGLTFKGAIRKARKARACRKDLAEIEKLSGWGAFWKHPKAPMWACWYAENVIKGRWPEAEPIIAKDPGWAYLYAGKVIKGRWPEAEPIIARDPVAAYLYARYVIKGPWPEAGIK